MRKKDLIIGIDPDVEESGMALLDRKTKDVWVKRLNLPKLVDSLKYLKKQAEEKGRSIVVVVEASWLISHNWHISRRKQTAASIAKTGYNVGRNHQVGMIISEYCQELGLEVVEQRPLAKSWRGRNGKITHKELSYFIPGLPKQTNQEERDAALLAWNESGLPIRVPPIGAKT